jgi:hypothetical protein
VKEQNAFSRSAYIGHEIVKTRGRQECSLQDNIHAHNRRSLLQDCLREGSVREIKHDSAISRNIQGYSDSDPSSALRTSILRR